MRRIALIWLFACSMAAFLCLAGFNLYGQQAGSEAAYHPSMIPLRFAPIVQETMPLTYHKTTADTCLGIGGQNWFNTSSSQLALPSTLSNLSFSIEGNFTVDQDLIFDNCRVKMGPNARIDVVGNARFTLRNTEISACAEMWDGIYLGTAAAYFSIENTPTGTLSPEKFQHAINGIVISNGANFRLDQAHLHNNLHHLQIKNANSIYSNTIFSSQFTCDPAGIGRAPYGQSITQKAIWVSDVDSIQLGESINTGPGLPGISTISNANTGIWVENSSIELSAFELKDIENCGLLALRNNRGRKSIHTNYPNYFSNMDYGVAILGNWGRFSPIINGCKFRNIREVGIYLYKPHPENVSCEGNHFTRIEKIGIWINQMGEAWGNIFGNAFQNPLSLDNYATAIYFSDIEGNQDRCGISIYSNTIHHFFTGIALLNVNTINSSFNNIYLNSTAHPSGMGTGIWAKNGKFHLTHRHRIASSTSAFASNKSGIYFSGILNPSISSSLFDNIGDGVVLSGISDGASLLCNRFKRYRRGVIANYVPFTGNLNGIRLSANEWIPFSGSVCETYSYYSDLSHSSIWHFTDTMPAKPLRNYVFPIGDPSFSAFSTFYPLWVNNCDYLNLPAQEGQTSAWNSPSSSKVSLADRPEAHFAQTHEPPIHLVPNVSDPVQTEASPSMDKQEVFNISIHPNPSPSGPYLSYYLPEGIQGEYQVYDALGKFLYKGTLQTGYQSHLAIPFSVAGGTYYLRAEISDGRRFVEKLVVTGE